jgi:DNA polymerase-3 subunit gamma/tau
MLEEHNRELSRELRSYFRGPLNLRSELREPNNKQEINDPYARFKQLQEKDPAIRLIVDLFGAELEY